MKEGQARHALSPEGLPLPARYQALAIAGAMFVAALVALVHGALGSALEGTILSFVVDRLDEAVLVAGIGAYWFLRKLLDGWNFVPGSAIVLDATQVAIPGFLLGSRSDVVLTPDQVQGIVLRQQHRSLGLRDRTWVLILRTSQRGDLTFWDESVDDLQGFAESLRDYLEKPLEIQTRWQVSPRRVFSGVVLGVLGFVGVMAVVFLGLSAFDKLVGRL